MKTILLFLFLILFHSADLQAQTNEDTLKKKEKKYTNYFNKRHFSNQYWILGLYAGTENFETASFGINFPIINQNMRERLFKKRPEKVSDTSFHQSFTFSFAAPTSGRYWIPTPLPKRLVLNVGLERHFNSLVFRPEIGIIATPFSLFFKQIGNGNIYLNHLLISTEYLPPIRHYNHSFRIGAGYMLKITRPYFLLFRSHGIRFYLLYHYNISSDWSGHLFTLQLNYNKEPYHYKFNPVNTGYRNW